MRVDVGAGTPWSRPRSQPARGRAGSMSWHLAPVVRGSGNAVCLRVFLNLVDHHSAGLVVRERLRVIAVARMHPHT